ncbi:unnamed protein product [Penicillium nalgiovense]|nr:unnamed protein product [Penicillium nalgiovense]
MNEFEKLQLIKNLNQIEAQLSAIQFPAYGWLFLRTDISRTNKREFWNAAKDPGIQFQALDYPLQSVNWLEISSRDHQGCSSISKGTIEEQTQLLESTESLMKLLDSNPILAGACQPTLWHTDLHMGNIFVAPDESSRIVSPVDFQSTPPQTYDYIKGIFQPQFSDNYDELDEESRDFAFREWSQVKLAKAYEVSTCLEDKAAYNAMNFPGVFRELFTRCGEISEVGVIPLRACLIEILQNWSSLRFSGKCPYSFSQDEIDAHEHQFAEYRAWHDVQAIADECLNTDAEGWIAPQLDINEKRRQNEEDKVSGEKSAEAAKAMWPFRV